MTPKKTLSNHDLFRSRLDNMIDMNHALIHLARQIDWSVFEHEFGPLYAEGVGRPGKPIRPAVAVFKRKLDQP